MEHNSFKRQCSVSRCNPCSGHLEVQSPYAPYEYSKGNFIFTENGEKLEGKIKFSEYEIEMKEYWLKVRKFLRHLCKGEYIKIKIYIAENTFNGTASYSERTIEVKGEK